MLCGITKQCAYQDGIYNTEKNLPSKYLFYILITKYLFYLLIFVFQKSKNNEGKPANQTNTSENN